MKEDLLTFVAKQFYEEKDLSYYTGLIDEFKSNKDDLINSHKYDEKELKRLLKVEDNKIRKYTFLLGNASLHLNKIHKMCLRILKLSSFNLDNEEINYNINTILNVINNSELSNIFNKEYSKIDRYLFKLKNTLSTYIDKHSKNIKYSKYFDEYEDKYEYLNDYIKCDYNLNDILDKVKEIYSKDIEEFSINDVQVISDYDEMLEYSYSIMDELNNIDNEYKLTRDEDRKDLLDRVSKMYKDISIYNLKVKYLDLFISYLCDSKYFKYTIKKINSIKNELLNEYNDKKKIIDDLYNSDYS